MSVFVKDKTMRQRMIDRLNSINGNLGYKKDGRWSKFYYTKYWDRLYSIQDAGPKAVVKHISEIDFNYVPDDKLIWIFESVVRQYYKQM